MQLLKLVYLAHGWMLGFNNRVLISELVEAWRYGPVVPSVYHLYKHFGRDPIISRKLIDQECKMDEDQIEIIDLTCEWYEEETGEALSLITHETGSPWDRAIKILGPGSKIPNQFIRDYYYERAEYEEEEEEEERP